MTELEALQTTLEAEHAAVYVYGLLGSRTSQAAEPELYAALRAAYEAHRERRDTLIGEIAALDAVPDAGRRGVHRADGARHAPTPATAAALELERACARTYAALVGSTTGARRGEAIDLLNDAAARELSFRGTPEIFPGTDEYADR